MSLVRLMIVLALAPGCSFAVVRGQSKAGAVDCTRSNGVAGIDLVIATVLHGLAAEARDEGNEGSSFVAHVAEMQATISAAYGFVRTWQCRRFRDTHRGAWDWVYVPALYMADRVRRDIQRVRESIEEVIPR